MGSDPRRGLGTSDQHFQPKMVSSFTSTFDTRTFNTRLKLTNNPMRASPDRGFGYLVEAAPVDAARAYSNRAPSSRGSIGVKSRCAIHSGLVGLRM